MLLQARNSLLVPMEVYLVSKCKFNEVNNVQPQPQHKYGLSLSCLVALIFMNTRDSNNGC